GVGAGPAGGGARRGRLAPHPRDDRGRLHGRAGAAVGRRDRSARTGVRDVAIDAAGPVAQLTGSGGANSTWNAAPPLAPSSTHARPPCSSANRATNDRPSPTPGEWGFALGPRSNG